MDQKRILELIRIFSEIDISEEDVTTSEEKNNGQLVLIVTYTFRGQTYKSQKLYYRNISDLEGISHKQNVLEYFEEPVFWLDISKHDWPQPSGESDLDELVVPEIAGAENGPFVDFLIQLANNKQTGLIQEITNDGRSGQYHHNLENNNHWHDLVKLIKAFINSKGQSIDKKYFSRLVFKWDGDKNTTRERATLTDQAYHCTRKLINDLKQNIMSVNNHLEQLDIFELLKFKHQIILQGPPGTGKTYTAKELAYQLVYGEKLDGNESTRAMQLRKLEESEQFALVQFHPAYSYEDFVRGIVAESTAAGILYETRNNLLAEFAELANRNYEDSKKDAVQISEQRWIDEMFLEFKEMIEEEIAENGKYFINPTAYTNEVQPEAFRYKGDNWGTTFRMPFYELKNLYRLGISARKQIKKHPEIKGRAKQHATYYFAMLSKFKDFLANKKKIIVEKITVPEKKYVLIIDEINRANLPAVLGELIYALEYRGEPVKSMYELDGDREIILPPNLIIIGTMNTADRSVGHIDYALRRRFAFIPISPDDSVLKGMQVDQTVIDRSLSLYRSVSALFDGNHMASDFHRSDVQLGHSYFMAPTIEQLDLRLEYEIKPILREYLKDGILLRSAESMIEELI